jgi:hypothetical protein
MHALAIDVRDEGDIAKLRQHHRVLALVVLDTGPSVIDDDPRALALLRRVIGEKTLERVVADLVIDVCRLDRGPRRIRRPDREKRNEGRTTRQPRRPPSPWICPPPV